LTLHNGLTWKKQLDNVINKAYRALYVQKHVWKNMGTDTKGGVPDIHCIVTFAVTVWWLIVKLKTSKAELSKLQRIACLGNRGATRMTPRVAIEVLLGLHPLNLQLELEAKAGLYKLYCTQFRVFLTYTHDPKHGKRPHPMDWD
jgi:hypothetical protein